MSWSVSIVERKLPVGPLDNLFLGRDASHSFLRFRDERGAVFCELHGMGESPATGKITPCPLDVRSCFSLAAWWLDRAVNWGPRLRVIALTKQADMDAMGRGRPVTEHSIFVGEPHQVARGLESGLRAARCINRANLGYYAFSARGGGQNCHSVMCELAERIGFGGDMPSLAYGAPGQGNDLGRSVPGLGDIRPCHRMTPSSVINSILAQMHDLTTQADKAFHSTIERALGIRRHVQAPSGVSQ